MLNSVVLLQGSYYGELNAIVFTKMSGEMLSGEQGFGIEPAVIQRFAREISVRDAGMK